MPKLNSFSLYLAKPKVKDFDELLSEKAHELLRTGSAKKATSATFADGGALYIFPGQPDTPRWVKLAASAFQIPTRVTAQSPCGVLVFKKNASMFALTFSFGHVYLDDANAVSCPCGLLAVVHRLKSVSDCVR